ncbi:hypothetical protein ACS0TY_014297 [Phlomoides rotata]
MDLIGRSCNGIRRSNPDSSNLRIRTASLFNQSLIQNTLPFPTLFHICFYPYADVENQRAKVLDSRRRDSSWDDTEFPIK